METGEGNICGLQSLGIAVSDCGWFAFPQPEWMRGDRQRAADGSSSRAGFNARRLIYARPRNRMTFNPTSEGPTHDVPRDNSAPRDW